MIRIWGLLRKRQKIIQDVTLEANSASLEDIHQTVDEICRALDIPRPIWLNKQRNEMERFGRTTFLSGDFMEPVTFDKFEIEILKEKGKSRDPRNDFS